MCAHAGSKVNHSRSSVSQSVNQPNRTKNTLSRLAKAFTDFILSANILGRFHTWFISFQLLVYWIYSFEYTIFSAWCFLMIALYTCTYTHLCHTLESQQMEYMISNLFLVGNGIEILEYMCYVTLSNVAIQTGAVDMIIYTHSVCPNLLSACSVFQFMNG